MKSPKLLKFSILSFLALFFCTATSARLIAAETDQDGDSWRWVRFGTQSGLPSDSIDSIVEGPDSTIWAATSAGLVRFDGYRWIAPDSSYGIPSGTSFRLRSSEDGVLAFDGRFKFFTIGAGGHHRFSVDSISEVVQSAPHSFLFKRADSIYTFENGTIKFSSMAVATYRTINEPTIWRTTSGSLWLHGIDGLFRFENGRWNLKIAERNEVEITQLLETFDHRIFITVTNPGDKKGIFEVDSDGRLHLISLAITDCRIDI